MNVDDLIGTPIIDLSTATTAGRVDDVFIDVKSRTVRGLRIGKATDDKNWLAWTDITAVGPDAVTIDTTDRLSDRPDDLGPGCRGGKVIGGRVLTNEGRELGALRGIDVDAGSGAISSLDVDGGSLAAETLLGIGTYATIVVDPAAGPH